MPGASRKSGGGDPITAPIRLLIERARKNKSCHHHEKLGVNHWITALRDLFPILPRDLTWDEIKAFDKRSRLKEGDPGKALPVDVALAKAERRAMREGRETATIDDVALTVLSEAGFLPEAPPSGPLAPAAAQREEPSPIQAPPLPETSVLRRFGRDLTNEVAEGLLPPVVGRHEPLALMLETLCRSHKHNVALVGPPGVGKRAIVEELARRIASGVVPAPLLGRRVIEVQLSSLLAGVNSATELNMRLGAVLQDAADPGIILFFDELRAITPAGHDGLTLAVSNELKPAIARGRITCIVSGAEEDYLRFVELDSSLRPWFHEWFQPIRIEELSAERTLEALELIAQHTKEKTGVATPPSVQRWLVAFAAELLKSHKFPGKAVDLLEQCVARAISEGRSKVLLSDAREVAERAIAIPADIESRLRRISKLLGASGLLRAEDRETLELRLAVTLRSLDLMPLRPNATVLLVSEAAAGARSLAETLADAIVGSPDRVVAVDFGLLTEPWDMRRLLGIAGAKGPPPEELPLEALIEAPWSVLLAENVDGCHPQVRASLTRALSEGYFTDARGRKIYLSDAVVIMSAPSHRVATAIRVGFGPGEPPGEVRSAMAIAFDRELVEQADLVVDRLERDASQAGVTHHEKMLADLVRRYRDRGLEITWDKSLVDWLRAPGQQSRSGKDWREWADRALASALIPHLPQRKPASPKRVIVRQQDDHVVVSNSNSRRR
jgi:ATP-dependent Clp protease ATP-binding subunit ClpC